MAKLLVVLALLLPALAAARHVATASTKQPLIVSGRAYCDNCQAGFETSVTKYIEGAKVKIQCGKDNKVTWTSEEFTTDSTGTYHISVNDEHEEEYCDVLLVSSPVKGCSKVDPGRDRARVILFRNNGMVSNNRVANNIGFVSDRPLAACAQVMQQYQLTDEDV
uniref:Uncharacterized protein n=1 Tax=Kalanchoe fedtschenkoi TaxID=63787 RepID=A0A7N0ZSP9_KALFE